VHEYPRWKTVANHDEAGLGTIFSELPCFEFPRIGTTLPVAKMDEVRPHVVCVKSEVQSRFSLNYSCMGRRIVPSCSRTSLVGLFIVRLLLGCVKDHH